MRIVLITLSLLLATTAQANPKLDMEPGKWQHSFSLQSAGGELEQAMAEMQKQLAARSDLWYNASIGRMSQLQHRIRKGHTGRRSGTTQEVGSREKEDDRYHREQ